MSSLLTQTTAMKLDTAKKIIDSHKRYVALEEIAFQESLPVNLYAEAVYELGMVHLERGEYRTANAYFAEAITFNSDKKKQAVLLIKDVVNKKKDIHKIIETVEGVMQYYSHNVLYNWFIDICFSNGFPHHAISAKKAYLKEKYRKNEGALDDLLFNLEAMSYGWILEEDKRAVDWNMIEKELKGNEEYIKKKTDKFIKKRENVPLSHRADYLSDIITLISLVGKTSSSAYELTILEAEALFECCALGGEVLKINREVSVHELWTKSYEALWKNTEKRDEYFPEKFALVVYRAELELKDYNYFFENCRNSRLLQIFLAQKGLQEIPGFPKSKEKQLKVCIEEMVKLAEVKPTVWAIAYARLIVDYTKNLYAQTKL